MEKEKTTTFIVVSDKNSRNMLLPPEGYDLLKTEEELDKAVQDPGFRDLDAEMMSIVLEKTGYREIHRMPKGHLHKFQIVKLAGRVFFNHDEGTSWDDPNDGSRNMIIRKIHFDTEYNGTKITETFRKTERRKA